MKINYDKVADAVYVTVKEGKVNKTVEVNEKLLIDLDVEGNMVGYEILDYSSEHDVEVLEESVKNGIPVQLTSTTPLVA